VHVAPGPTVFRSLNQGAGQHEDSQQLFVTSQGFPLMAKSPPNPSTAFPNLTQRQIMLSFAYLAYCGESMTTASPESEILGYINAAMPQIPPLRAPNPTWQVVWGPAVYTTPGALYQDNLMFVAQNQTDTSQFAIAIRGTNRSSDLDWLMDDLDILDMMNWPPGTKPSPTGPRISESTSIGLQVLLGMQGSPTSAPISLIDFLRAQTAKAINVCVTGHSLGGCLAPTLALYLKEQQNAWDLTGNSNVSTITFAGPTAGNSEFAAYSDSKFSGGPYPPNWDPSLGTTCDVVRCDLDVAPFAWIASSISATKDQPNTPLFSTYASPNVPSPPNLDFLNLSGWGPAEAWIYVVQNVFPIIGGIVGQEGYTQIMPGATPIEGTFQSPISNLVPPPSDGLTDYLKAFVAEAAYQHGSSYPTILQVPCLLDKNIIKTGQST
jgi:hypothetical protein